MSVNTWITKGNQEQLSFNNNIVFLLLHLPIYGVGKIEEGE